MKSFFAITLSFLLLQACSKGKSKQMVDENDIVLAAVAESKLLLSDIGSFNFLDLSEEDSILFLKNYTSSWIKNEVMVLKAKDILNNTDKIKAKAKAFENELIKAAYQKRILENLEISLTEEDLLKYYNEHKDYFLFEENHFEIKYIILPKTVSNLQQIRKTISENKNSNFLSSYCTNNQGKCHVKVSIVKGFSFLSGVLNMTENQLKESTSYKYHYIDDDNVMIYQILAIKEKGTTADLEIVQKEVSVLAKHNKEEEYLLELEEKTYQKAKNDEIFENYIN